MKEQFELQDGYDPIPVNIVLLEGVFILLHLVQSQSHRYERPAPLEDSLQLQVLVLIVATVAHVSVVRNNVVVGRAGVVGVVVVDSTRT